MPDSAVQSGSAVRTARNGSTPPARIVLVLITADWAGPAKPASTLLRELSRRWGPTVRTVILESPEDEVLDLLEVDVVPTWLRLEQGAPDSADPSSENRALVLENLSGATPTGESTVLSGAWTLTRRRSGALPKHVVAEELGPDASTRPPGSDGTSASSA